MDIDTLKAKQEELQELLKEHGKPALLAGFEKLFEQCPDLQAVRWTQYTPSFNDGGPCTFGLGETFFRLIDTPEGAGEREDGFDYRYGQEAGPYKDQLVEAERAASHLVFRAPSKLFEMAFGDNKRVTVYRDLRVESEYYENY